MVLLYLFRAEDVFKAPTDTFKKTSRLVLVDGYIRADVQEVEWVTKLL